VEQRNARLASAVKVEIVKGRDGEVAKGTVTIISNTRRESGDDRVEEATAIQRTVWGKQAENAAEYLGKGSRVNVVGRLRNNNYTDGEVARSTGCPSPARRSTTSTARPNRMRARGGRNGPNPAKREQASAADQKAKHGRATRTGGQSRGAAAY